MLTGIDANGLRISLVRAFTGTTQKFRTKRSDEKLRPKRDIPAIFDCNCCKVAMSTAKDNHLLKLPSPTFLTAESPLRDTAVSMNYYLLQIVPI